MLYKSVLCLVSCVLCLASFAQETFLPLNRDIYGRHETELNKLNNTFHTSIKPYRIAELKQHLNVDSIDNTLYFDSEKARTLFGRKLRKENLIQVNTEDFHLTIDPLFNLELGRNFTNDSNAFVNGRGILVTGSIGHHLSFSSSFYENQATFVNYLDKYIETGRVVPGQGYVKGFAPGKTFGKLFKGNAYDYAMASGYISYTPSKYFNFQFGHDKNFIGDGYRSLLLSDNSFNYPFLKITTNIWKLQYVNLYTSFLDTRDPLKFNSTGFDKKYASFHYLSWNILKRVNIGFFEGIVWRSEDTAGYKGYDINYLNPIIFLRPVEFSLGSSDNALMGLNLKVKITDGNLFYGQLLLDEFRLSKVKSGQGWYANKQAFQLGLKSFNLFTVKYLNFQTEYNFVRPYTYTHYNIIQNYAHYNQPLAHPLGANFWEAVSFLNYRYKSFFIEAKFSYTLYGADTAGLHYGKDIYASYLDYVHENGNYVGQGLKNTLIYKDIRIAYIVNPKTNFHLEAGITNRMQTNAIEGTKTTNFIYFGIRTSLTNHYYDF